MLHGEPPFAADDQMQTYKRIMAGRYFVEGHVSSPAKDLIRRLLLPNPAMRIGMLKGGADDVLEEVRIELPIDAHLPHELHRAAVGVLQHELLGRLRRCTLGGQLLVCRLKPDLQLGHARCKHGAACRARRAVEALDQRERVSVHGAQTICAAELSFQSAQL